MMTWNPAGHTPGRIRANLLTIPNVGKWVGGMKPRYSPVIGAAVCLLMALTGCGRKAEAPAPASDSAPAPAAVPGEVRHPLTGEILKADPETQALIVTHD